MMLLLVFVPADKTTARQTVNKLILLRHIRPATNFGIAKVGHDIRAISSCNSFVFRFGA